MLALNVDHSFVAHASVLLGEFEVLVDLLGELEQLVESFFVKLVKSLLVLRQLLENLRAPTLQIAINLIELVGNVTHLCVDFFLELSSDRLAHINDMRAQSLLVFNTLLNL